MSKTHYKKQQKKIFIVSKLYLFDTLSLENKKYIENIKSSRPLGSDTNIEKKRSMR